MSICIYVCTYDCNGGHIHVQLSIECTTRIRAVGCVVAVAANGVNDKGSCYRQWPSKTTVTDCIEYLPITFHHMGNDVVDMVSIVESRYLGNGRTDLWQIFRSSNNIHVLS